MAKVKSSYLMTVLLSSLIAGSLSSCNVSKDSSSKGSSSTNTNSTSTIISNSSVISSNVSSTNKESNSSSLFIPSNGWDISLKGNGSITAELIESNDEYELVVYGKGEMKSFDNEKTPWNQYANKITNVLIGNGPTNLGSKVFGGIDVKYIYVPESITSIEDYAADDDVSLLAYTDDIIYSDEVKNVYSNVAWDIDTIDIYWKSGNSSDVIPNDYKFDTHKNYWYFGDDGEPVIKTKTKILFIGNSFTFQNGITENGSGIPGIFDNLAQSLGYNCETYYITGPGWYLDSHANSNDSCGKQIDKLLNACNDFDYIVLQEQSMNPFRNYNRFLNGIKALQTKINNTQVNAEIVLYQTWGSPYSANEMGTTIAGMEKQLRDAYYKAAEECGISLVSPVGKAFTKSYYENSSYYLWAGDNRHQSYLGSYLSACVHVSNIFGVDVRNTTFDGEAEHGAPNLPDSTYQYLREVAYQVVIEQVEVDYTNEDPSNGSGPAVSEDVVVIAGWGRFIEEERFNLLVEDYEKYLNENEIEYTSIVGRYYNNDSYRPIANFSSQILTDGGTDIVVPCADDFNNNQDNFDVLRFSDLITVYGQDNRRRAALTSEYELTIAFFDYLKTDSAVAILGNQNPAGDDEPVEKDETVITIAAWGRFIEEERFNLLVADFKKYLDENGIEYTSVVANYYPNNGYNLKADFIRGALNDGGADIILPCATNFNDSNTTLVGLGFQPITVFNQTNRQVTWTSEYGLVSSFLEYVQIESAVAILGNENPAQ